MGMSWFMIGAVIGLTVISICVTVQTRAQTLPLPQTPPVAEPIPPARLRTHQLMVVVPGFPMKVRGKPQSETACKLDMASERMSGGWPEGTTFECKDLKIRR